MKVQSKMIKKAFTLRVDLESFEGIKEGLPPLLDLLKKYDMKASFYVVMGGESNFLELLKYRKKMKSSGERSMRVWSFREKLRKIFFPRDFVKENIKIIERILEEGHELGMHGWKHREWTRGLEKIDPLKKIIGCKKRYSRLFGKNPISWASPGFNTNPLVEIALEKEGIKFVSDFSGEKVSVSRKIKNVPMTILGHQKMPIIEYLASKKMDDKEILEFMKSRIMAKKLSSFYIHGFFEARYKLKLLEEIFKFVKDNKIEVKRVIDY